ncbi:MAG: DUF1573 domain-containing protein [Bacteroidetes bacterium]|nr:DUF1573 domain-containing protein [Bacteroidota bacterium]
MIRFIAFFALTLFFSCQSEQKSIPANLVNNPKSASGIQSTDVPQITFNKVEHDFGRLIQGEQVIHVFKFTNTGSSDLLISKVSASCGCTASKYTRDPVKPGQEGKVEITFDSNGQRGIQNKTITVLTNGIPQMTTLRVKAQVVTTESY